MCIRDRAQPEGVDAAAVYADARQMVREAGGHRRSHDGRLAHELGTVRVVEQDVAGKELALSTRNDEGPALTTARAFAHMPTAFDHHEVKKT